MAVAAQARSLRTSGPANTVTLKSKKHKAIKADDIIAFFQQMSTLLTAGTPLLRSIQVAGAQSESTKLVALIHQIASEVSSGSPLNEALTHHPRIFEYQWIEMIKAGALRARQLSHGEDIWLYRPASRTYSETGDLTNG